MAMSDMHLITLALGWSLLEWKGMILILIPSGLVEALAGHGSFITTIIGFRKMRITSRPALANKQEMGLNVEGVLLVPIIITLFFSRVTPYTIFEIPTPEETRFPLNPPMQSKENPLLYISRNPSVITFLSSLSPVR
ncbi:hypothetical protein H6P81_007454 [Aristolochia fimbriata]|uniref:NADH:ubiquinone reductase (H(+)-translocating) n=1 Tax=Aristolochia fimbriata TaxID=158543 RepID=A0AAV7F093_ARIFI|nr:hypothetical protein H6P81_007454 [Aristolochia fimbriata]